jgi:hypothetical protein
MTPVIFLQWIVALTLGAIAILSVIAFAKLVFFGPND